MKPLIVTHDLINEKSHLMPWRTLCEVTNNFRKHGHDVTFISLDDNRVHLGDTHLPEGVLPIRKSYHHLASDLAKLFRTKKPDVIFWPISWREPRRRTKITASFGVPIIGYFPGGCYLLSSVFYAIKMISLKASIPYLLEAVAPKSRQIAFFKSHGFRHMIAITDLTARWVIRAGWPEDRIIVIPPGKEKKITAKNAELQGTVKKWLAGRPFYLFMGPPDKIRGVYELLRAFDKTADKLRNICLICLFRADGRLDTEKIRDILSKLKNRNRIYTIWESLGKSELDSFLNACHAQILPFILIPSEIPLAVIETMAFGKPVITTKSGGTGEFVLPFGIAVPPGDVDALVQAMVDLVENQSLYEEKCRSAADNYQIHPSWEDVSLQWIKVAESVLEAESH